MTDRSGTAGSCADGSVPREIEVAAHAKLNLYLEVLGRRSDGYHEILSLFHEIDLADRIVLERRNRGGIRIRCDTAEVPGGSSNLAWRAAELAAAEIGVRPDLQITMEKRVPVGAGLGGGSSDAAAVLAAMPRLYGKQISVERQAKLAARLGSDVPFFVFGGTAVCRGRGEIVEPVVATGVLHFALVIPEFRMSTREVYAKWDEMNRIGGDLSNQNKKEENVDPGKKEFPLTREARERIMQLVNGILSGGARGAAGFLHNALSGAALALRGDLVGIRKEIEAQGALGAGLSGSGSCVFGLFSSFDSVGEAVAALRIDGFDALCVKSYLRDLSDPR